MPHLHEETRFATSGARAVADFAIDGVRYLAVPQLAMDAPGTEPDMNGGDSTTTFVLVLSDEGTGGTRFTESARLPAPGGEDAEFFTIGDRSFLAVASIRNGSGPYDYAQPQRIYERTGGGFEEIQSIQGYAGKQWRHFEVDGRHFLGLAQGVALPGHEAANLPSRIYEWTGERFEHLQDVDSAWGYNWHAVTVGEQFFLAYADHVKPSVLLRWTGERFEVHQQLIEKQGRSFTDFVRGGEHYLAAARLQGDSEVLRWDGERFQPHQTLERPGGRELALIERPDALYLLRVDFITGTPHDPVTEQRSPLYRWDDAARRFDEVEHIGTLGGTDAAVFPGADGRTFVAVSNSLAADARFRTDTVLYSFTD